MGPIATELAKLALQRLAKIDSADVAKAARVATRVGGAAAGVVGVGVVPAAALLLTGAALGVGVTLLVAPDSGAVTRAKLKARLKRAVRRVRPRGLDVIEAQGEAVATPPAGAQRVSN